MSRGLMEYVENSRKALEADAKRAKARKAKFDAANSREQKQINTSNTQVNTSHT